MLGKQSVRSMKTHTSWLTAVWVMMLVACATQTTDTPRPEWPTQKKVALQLTHWSSVVAVQGVRQANTIHSEVKFNADIGWHADGNINILQLLGLFGEVHSEYVFDINNPANNSLRIDANRQIIGREIDQFIHQHFGMTQMDVYKLRSWIVGVPYDESQAQIIRNQKNQLTAIQESDTLVQYVRFVMIGDLLLPRTINIANQLTQLTVWITWEKA